MSVTRVTGEVSNRKHRKHRNGRKTSSSKSYTSSRSCG